MSIAEQVAEHLREEYRRRVYAVADALLIRLQETAPISEGPTSGNLRDSITVDVSERGDSFVLTIRIGVEYASYVIEGTEPHEIVPRDPSGVLAFEIDGVTIFAKRVEHPGTMPNDFLRDAIESWTDLLVG